MSFFSTIILGAVEGFTEFLPISSTGHLILTSRLLELNQDNFLKSFEIIIQLGAISAVMVLYFNKFFLNLEVIKRIIIAFVPTAILGFFFYSFVKDVLLGNMVVVLWSLFLGGVILIVFELWYKNKEKSGEKSIQTLPYFSCFLIGLFQSISIIPGVSRAAATILGGLWLGVSRRTIVEFSFLLAIPTMAGATGLDLINNISSFSYDQLNILIVGFIFSFITAILAIKFLLSFIQKNNFIYFGFYRIILAIVFWVVFL